MTSSPSGIVVAFDGSPDALAALAWAAETASLSQVPVLAVIVDVPDSRVPRRAVKWGEKRVGEIREVAERYLKDAGIADASAEVRSGTIVPTLLKASEAATLLVVGSRGHGPVSEAFGGSVSQHLARHATCPVVLVRPVAESSAMRIVVGVDGSAESRVALEFASRRAELTGDAVVALHGWMLPSVPVLDGGMPVASPERASDEERLLAEFVADVRRQHPEVTFELESIPEAAGRALVRASNRASLIVVGSRGRGAFAGLLLGSVSEHVVRGAHCPVAVIRERRVSAR